MNTERPQVPFVARTIRRLSVLIILAWVALTLAGDVRQFHRWRRSAKNIPYHWLPKTRRRCRP